MSDGVSRPMPCHYPLSDIKQIVRDDMSGTADKVWFPYPEKSLNAVVEAFRGTSKRMTVEKAKSYIFETILELTENDYCNHFMYSNWGIVDVYGFKKDGIPWYIKFRIEDGFLPDLSFHPFEKDMILENKLVIKKERTLT